MGTATCKHISINFRRSGKGQDVVLIHGLAANQAFWYPTIFQPLAREYRVTTYDLRGHGYSEMPPNGYTTADMAEDLHHLLNYLSIAKAHLVGHSFGGTIALHYAVLHPDRVLSLTIADSRVRVFQPTLYFKDWPHWIVIKSRLEDMGLSVPEDNPESGLWFLEQFADPAWRQAREKLNGSPLFVPSGPWGGNGSADRWLEVLKTTTAREDFSSSAGLTLDSLETIQQPALAVFGEHSPVMPSLRGLENHLKSCKALIIPGAGHFCLLRHPDLFVSTFSEFINAL